MFKLNLSAESRARLDAEQREIDRLYGLTHTWLAHAILKLAREARKLTPRHQPEDPTYDARLVWGIVPELARRLGPVSLQIAEIDWEIRDLSDYELRVRLGNTIANIAHSSLEPWALLTRTPVNGNPLVFAIDRLCPGKIGDMDDRITRGIAEVAYYRGKDYEGIWTPAIGK